MSKYCGWVNNQPYDYVFKKNPNKGWYTFFLGKYRICQVAPKYRRNTDKIRSWTVIVDGHVDPNALRMVHGFATRNDAVEYALLVHELTREQYIKYV